MSSRTPVTATHFDPRALAAELTGRVVTPTDPDYDALRTVVLGGIDPHPLAIVRPADAVDVSAAVRAGAAAGLEIAIRSGGHSGAAHSTVDDGLVIDVRDLDTLDIDPVARTAWAGSGLTAGDYTVAAARHGLATGFGDTASVGLGGLVTGGGIGYLARKHGMTIDALLAAEVVTADGAIHLVDADHEPDLFWAIRGGGSNMGIVTRFQLRLFEVPEVTGGMLILPATPEVIAGFMAEADAAPEALSGIANVMPCPPMPSLPEALHGQIVVLALLCYAGDADAGEAALRPFRSLAEPLADMLKPMTYPEMFPDMHPGDEEYHPLAVARTLFMDHLGLDEARAILGALEASDAAMRVAQLRVLGGEMGRVAPDATAYAHRDRRIMVNVAAFYEGDGDRAARLAWVEALADRLTQGAPAAYVNFLGEEGEAGVARAYPPETRRRLAEIKRRYDPTNLFRRNHNIAPAEPPAESAAAG